MCKDCNRHHSQAIFVLVKQYYSWTRSCIPLQFWTKEVKPRIFPLLRRSIDIWGRIPQQSPLAPVCQRQIWPGSDPPKSRTISDNDNPLGHCQKMKLENNDGGFLVGLIKSKKTKYGQRHIKETIERAEVEHNSWNHHSYWEGTGTCLNLLSNILRRDMWRYFQACWEWTNSRVLSSKLNKDIFEDCQKSNRDWKILWLCTAFLTQFITLDRFRP